MPEGIVREQHPTESYENCPLWIRHVLQNTAAYADFHLDITKSIRRCDALIADHLEKDDNRSALKMLGKREALKEIQFILEAYRREENINNG